MILDVFALEVVKFCLKNIKTVGRLTSIFGWDRKSLTISILPTIIAKINGVTLVIKNIISLVKLFEILLTKTNLKT